MASNIDKTCQFSSKEFGKWPMFQCILCPPAGPRMACVLKLGQSRYKQAACLSGFLRALIRGGGFTCYKNGVSFTYIHTYLWTYMHAMQMYACTIHLYSTCIHVIMAKNNCAALDGNCALPMMFLRFFQLQWNPWNVPKRGQLFPGNRLSEKTINVLQKVAQG